MARPAEVSDEVKMLLNGQCVILVINVPATSSVTRLGDFRKLLLTIFCKSTENIRCYFCDNLKESTFSIKSVMATF